MFYFRLNRVKIADNGDGKFMGIFGSDKSKIQFISLVSTEVSTPDLEEIITEIDPEARKEKLRQFASTVASLVKFTPIHNVRDKRVVTFGPTGRLLHFQEVIPRFFTWQFLCVKLNNSTRHLATELNEAVNAEKFDDFAGQFPVLVGKTAAAPYLAGVAIGKFVLDVFTRHLMTKKDKQLGIIETSFVRMKDYPYGNADFVDVLDETENLEIDYTIFSFEEEV